VAYLRARAWPVPRLLAALSAAGIALASQPATAASLPATLTMVGRSALNNRGMNAAVALAAGCAYVGSRNDAAPLVVDVSDPAAPQVAGVLAAHKGSTPRELRAIASLKEVVVMYYDLNGGPNLLDIYRWTIDCRVPTLVGSFDLGSLSPHEFYLWQDPQQPSRVLLYVAMFRSGNALTVIDISDPTRPNRVGGWSVPAGYGAARLHSIAVSADGRLAYLSLWLGGLAIADVSTFARGAALPALRPLTEGAGVYRTPPGNVHSAVPAPGTALVVTTDERYPAPYGEGCPYGTAHVVDVSNPSRPAALSEIAIPENDPARCGAVSASTWTSHNPTLTSHLALVSWYSGGLQVIGLDDPAHPQRLAELRPSAVNPNLRDLQLGPSDAMTWSYPVIFKGLVYVVDINQGLLILRYAGPHQEEVAGAAFAEGNSNLASSLASAPTPKPAASPAASASPTPVASRDRGSASGTVLPVVAAGGVAMLALLGVLVVAWRRRAGRPAG
jgi:hypothetical protein